MHVHNGFVGQPKFWMRNYAAGIMQRIRLIIVNRIPVSRYEKKNPLNNCDRIEWKKKWMDAVWKTAPCVSLPIEINKFNLFKILWRRGSNTEKYRRTYVQLNVYPCNNNKQKRNNMSRTNVWRLFSHHSCLPAINRNQCPSLIFNAAIGIVFEPFDNSHKIIDAHREDYSFIPFLK